MRLHRPRRRRAKGARRKVALAGAVPSSRLCLHRPRRRRATRALREGPCSCSRVRRRRRRALAGAAPSSRVCLHRQRRRQRRATTARRETLLLRVRGPAVSCACAAHCDGERRELAVRPCSCDCGGGGERRKPALRERRPVLACACTASGGVSGERRRLAVRPYSCGSGSQLSPVPAAPTAAASDENPPRGCFCLRKAKVPPRVPAPPAAVEAASDETSP